MALSPQEAVRRVTRSSAQRIRRIVAELRERYKDVPRPPTFREFREFSKVSQHPAAEVARLRENVSRLIDVIQDEDRARLLEPRGPKFLRGRPPIRRPKTAIIALAAKRAYEKRVERERLAAAAADFARRA